MIEEPPLLTIRRAFERPPPAVLEAFRGAPTSVVADSQSGRGGLDHRIKPLQDGDVVIGPALTCWCGPCDNLAALAALELAEPGDVLVIATDGWEGAAVVGDRYAAMAAKRRLGGLVTDGLLRDRAGILAAGFACWGRGLSPNSPYFKGPGVVGLPVVLGGVAVESGDVVVADAEGVVVVSRKDLPATLAMLERVKANEVRMERELAAGLDRFEFVAGLLASARTRWVD
jgi:4-hydroxy-4-methyl-2-oxoglutarate aldolase